MAKNLNLNSLINSLPETPYEEVKTEAPRTIQKEPLFFIGNNEKSDLKLEAQKKEKEPTREERIEKLMKSMPYKDSLEENEKMYENFSKLTEEFQVLVDFAKQQLEKIKEIKSLKNELGEIQKTEVVDEGEEKDTAPDTNEITETKPIVEKEIESFEEAKEVNPEVEVVTEGQPEHIIVGKIIENSVSPEERRMLEEEFPIRNIEEKIEEMVVEELNNKDIKDKKKEKILFYYYRGNKEGAWKKNKKNFLAFDGCGNFSGNHQF